MFRIHLGSSAIDVRQPPTRNNVTELADLKDVKFGTLVIIERLVEGRTGTLDDAWFHRLTDGYSNDQLVDDLKQVDWLTDTPAIVVTP